MENLTFWDSVKAVPENAQKKITGGRLSGMTDISPMWRYHELTKAFGPCGVGWQYSIDKLWLEKGAADTVCAFAQISLLICTDKGWSAPIPGIGGSMLVAKESGGLHTSDEAYKMAVTDALSVACKMLGMGADVYWSAGSKYTTGNAPTPPVSHSEPVSEPKHINLWNRCLHAANGDAKAADLILKTLTIFTPEGGEPRFLQHKDLGTKLATEKWLDRGLKNAAQLTPEKINYILQEMPY